MKKLFTAVLMIAALFIFSGQAAAAIKVYDHNLSEGLNDLTLPGYVGAKQSDNVTIIWTVAHGQVTPANCTGAYFWIRNVDGTATSVKLNFYTSYFASGDADWAKFMPKDAVTGMPTDYDLTMPGANATWNEPIPFPEGTQRVKSEMEISDNDSTDNITIKMIPSIK